MNAADADFHAGCVKAIETKLQLTLKHIRRSLYVSGDGTTAIVCVTSKLHPNKAFQFWFTIQQEQADFLAEHKQGFLVLGCGSPEIIFTIPFQKFEPWRKKLLASKRNGNHIRINRESNSFYLHFKGRGEKVEITNFLVADAEAFPNLDDVDIHTAAATEGRRRLVLHLQRERNQTVVRNKKKQAASLDCEVCAFSFSRSYGNAASEYCEAHHLLLLSEVEHTTQTRIEDLAILCANCHRVVHLRNPPYTLDEVRNMITFPKH